MASEIPNSQRVVGVSHLQNKGAPSDPHGKSLPKATKGLRTILPAWLYSATLAFRSQAILAIRPKVKNSEGNNGQGVQAWTESKQRLGTSPS